MYKILVENKDTEQTKTVFRQLFFVVMVFKLFPFWLFVF